MLGDLISTCWFMWMRQIVYQDQKEVFTGWPVTYEFTAQRNWVENWESTDKTDSSTTCTSAQDSAQTMNVSNASNFQTFKSVTINVCYSTCTYFYKKLILKSANHPVMLQL